MRDFLNENGGEDYYNLFAVFVVLTLLKMVNLIKKNVQIILNRFGYSLHRFEIADLRGDGKHPLEAFYMFKRETPFLIDVPLEKCRGLLWFKVKQHSHPFVDTLFDVFDNGKLSLEGSPLESFYNLYQPSDVAEAMGFHGRSSHAFSGINPTATPFLMPWLKSEPTHALSNRMKEMVKENAIHGQAITAEAGDGLSGPVKSDKAELEFKRLVDIAESIRRYGYRRSDLSDGDLRGHVLVDSFGDYVIQIRPGQHRIAALAYLGFETVPVRLWRSKFYRETEVDFWPQVRQGRVSVDDALSVFRRIMAGEPPPACRWPE